MDAELKRLTISRDRIVAAVDEFKVYIDTLNRDNIDGVNLLTLRTKFDRVSPKYDEFVNIHYKICDIQAVEDRELLSKFEQTYDDATSLAKYLLNGPINYQTVDQIGSVGDLRSIGNVPDGNRSVLSNDDQVLPDSQQEFHFSTAGSINSFNKVKLPRISLPTFDGKNDQWFEFRDMFRALVHDDDSLSNVQKLYYLKGSLINEAKTIIQGIKTTNENYEAAWQCLCDRYENKRLLIHNHLTSLYDIKGFKGECPKAFRNLIDLLNVNMRALENLEQPVEQWDAIIIFWICKKLDATTVKEWENVKQPDIIPTLEDFKTFIRNRADMLESVSQKLDKHPISTYKQKTDKSFKVEKVYNARCYFCEGDHAIYYCTKFKALDVDARINAVHKLNLCPNCLRHGHMSKECDREPCRKCRYAHNSLLHREKTIITPSSMHASNDIRAKGEFQHTLLSTALVNVKTRKGLNTCRVLLDNGSQINLITIEAAKRLGVKINYKTNDSIDGVGNYNIPVHGKCQVPIFSRNSNFSMMIDCYILSDISHGLLKFDLKETYVKIPNNLKLADPKFFDGGKIDILIGAVQFWNILTGKLIKAGTNLPVFAESKLGWIVSGTFPVSMKCNIVKCLFTSDLREQLTKFWEVEDFPTNTNYLSDDENYAEVHFKKHVSRDDTGRFVVAIPFKENKDIMLGDSKVGAEKRFFALERRLQSNEMLRNEYIKFMREYEELKHMTLIPNFEENKSLSYFLPHHCVINSTSTTTRVRVVFDASLPTSTGVSRNEIEHIGPTVQSDLLEILLRFRWHNIVITADIVKMYRQILVREEDRNMQYILWRERPTNPIRIYRLNTVTYGTASGAFLATRCLKEIANSIHTNETLSTTIKEDFYVDDILTGAENIDKAQNLCKELKETLSLYGFELQKWYSNCPQAIKNVVNHESDNAGVTFDSNTAIKMLGLYWLPTNDTFSYTVNYTKAENVTKRLILSKISQIFDPLGLVGASIILPKIFLQKLWELKLDWDSPVPENIKNKWIEFEESLLQLNDLKIPRHIIANNAYSYEIHGFSDASERAYGACLYLRSRFSNGYVSNLICAKSKVAPLKTLTIPRLELCAALLLAKLMTKVIRAFRKPFEKIYLWTDSEIVLCWIKKSPNSLKIFVANRVNKIQELSGNSIWRHISSIDNPADLISRGIMPHELIKSTLWWRGPGWLQENENFWPSRKADQDIALPDLKIQNNSLTCALFKPPIEFSRFSNYQRLLRAMAYALRFIARAKKTDKENERMLFLSASELKNADIILCKFAQQSCFREEISQLSKGNPVKSSSKLKALCPFIDADGVLRITGRLQNANLDFDSKHQIILPRTHILTDLIFRYEHLRLGHAGPLSLLCAVRSKYWPIHGKALAQKTCRNCITCFKNKPRNMAPLMGALPQERVNNLYPFHTVGVDYAGPIIIKHNKGRGNKTNKAYIAIFICFTTKAIHIEIATDLTTAAFIAAFRRFVSRRGRPAIVWSDNGTNFVGARNELHDIIQKLSADDSIASLFATENIDWKFIPSNSPHFGGIWESGVKNIKFHLKRMVGNHMLVYEELCTICCQIEAIINSRPLTTLSDDPSDPAPLTPSHFLVGRKLSTLPDEPLEHIAFNRLSRYQRLQQLIQHFWRRWSKEYLNTLQMRPKWNSQKAQIKLGDIVIVKNENFPPMKWPLARVTELHPGADGVTRVASIFIHGTTLRRAVHKLYPMPMDLDQGAATKDSL